MLLGIKKYIYRVAPEMAWLPIQGLVDWQARKRATDDSALCACDALGDSWYNSTNLVQECNELARYTINQVLNWICLRVLRS